MKLIYQTKVTNLGVMAADFFVQRMIIMFQDNAPEELADYCVLHSENRVLDIIQENDVLVIAGREYKIIDVGEDVQTNLQNLGHITLRFDGSTGGLSGSLYLEDNVFPNIRIGDKIEIYRK